MQELKNGKKKKKMVLMCYSYINVERSGHRAPDGLIACRGCLLMAGMNYFPHSRMEKLFQMLMCNKEVKCAVLKTSI